MMQAIESENSGPLVWHDESWARDSARRLNACDSCGTIVHINLHWGHSGQCSSFTASRNIERLLENLEPIARSGDPIPESAIEFRRFFGQQQGDVVCEAARLVAAIPLNMTAILHLQREGFTFHLQPWFDGKWRWPGVLGDERMDPPPWANPDGLITLRALLNAVEQNPKAIETVIAGAPDNVVGRLDVLASGAARAVALLEELHPPVEPAARTELRHLLASAHIAHSFALETAVSLRARIAWQIVKSCGDEHMAESARTITIQHYEKAIASLRAQLSWAMALAGRFPDYLRHVVESHETFYRLPLATRLKIRNEELRRIRALPWPVHGDDMTIDFAEFINS